MGGFAVGDILGQECTAGRPCRFKAAVAVAGGYDVELAKNYTHVPLWLAHGQADEGVKPHGTNKLLEKRERPPSDETTRADSVKLDHYEETQARVIDEKSKALSKDEANA
jgi:predicted peptidase